MRIPLVDLNANYHGVKEEIDRAIAEVINNSSFILGPHVEKFEENWANFCSTKYCVGLASGTEAVRLAVKAYGITRGDEVITVPNTFIATTEAISDSGARPVFVDINEKTQTIDVKKIEGKITKRTKAIICVHLYGHSCDMDPILDLGRKYNLKIIEDCAQAHGAEYKGLRVGSLGDIGCFSFFPAKILGAFGDAGAITTNNSAIAEKIRLYSNHGRTSKHKSILEGYNSRMDTIQAAILNAKLPHLEKWIGQRKTISKKYSEKLNEEVEVPEEAPWGSHAYYMYVIRTSKRDELKEYLKKGGIGTGIHYPIPLHLQGAYDYLKYKKYNFPIAEKLAEEILSLPLYPELTKEKQTYIINKIREFFSNNGGSSPARRV